MNEASQQPRVWLWLSLAVLAVYVGAASYPGCFVYMGLSLDGRWFLDWHAILAACDAVVAGLDPLKPNPLDPYQRPHVYSHWWLGLRYLGMTRADTFWTGLVVVGAFIGAALAYLRPHERRQALVYFAVLCSPPLLLAFNRANNDLVIFGLLLLVVPLLRHRSNEVQAYAALTVLCAAALKYYPAVVVLLALAPTHSTRLLRGRCLVALAVVVIAGWSVSGDLSTMGSLVPNPSWVYTLGSTSAFELLACGGQEAVLLCAAVGGLVFGLGFLHCPLGAWQPKEEHMSSWLFFIMGASVLTGCFFAGMSYGYRWVFGVFLLPFLWQTSTDVTAPAVLRLLGRTLLALLLFLLWYDLIAMRAVFALIGGGNLQAQEAMLLPLLVAAQGPTWAFFCGLLVFLAHFVRRGILQLFGVVSLAHDQDGNASVRSCD
jgi:hypothetical protein